MVVGICLLGLAFGVCMTLNGGVYIFQLFNWYSAGWNLILIALFEIIVVMGSHGFESVMDNLEEMRVKVPWILRIYFKATWQFLTPLVLSKKTGVPRHWPYSSVTTFFLQSQSSCFPW